MSDELNAIIGRKQVELETLHLEYNRLLAVLGQVASGEVERERVSVDLDARTWTVAPQQESLPKPH